MRDLIAKGLKYREPCKVDWDKNLSLLCEAVDQYALQWAKQEMVKLSVLSSQIFKQPTGKVLQNADVKAGLSDLHNKYVFVPADKAPNNIITICKKYYIETLIKELGLDNCSTPAENSTYTSCQMSSDEVVNTHGSGTFMKYLGIELSLAGIILVFRFLWLQFSQMATLLRFAALEQIEEGKVLFKKGGSFPTEKFKSQFLELAWVEVLQRIFREKFLDSRFKLMYLEE